MAEFAGREDLTGVNIERGAPLTVRNAVGGAKTRKDRMATLKQFYPDAEYYGDNFIFTDPETNERVLYNPQMTFMGVPRPDIGDIASITPEISELVGGAAGVAAVLNPATLATTGGASAALAIPAYGLGAAGGREFEQIVAQQLAGRKDTREPYEKGIDVAVTVVSNMAAQKYGDALQRGLKLAGKKVRTATTANLADFRKHKIDPMLSAVHASPFIQSMEQGLSTMLASSDIMIRKSQNTIRQIGEAVENLSAKYGPSADVYTAGTAIRHGAAKWRQQLHDTSEYLYNSLDRVLAKGEGGPVDLSRTLGAIYSTVNLFKSAPELGEELTGGQILKYGDLLTKAGGRLGSWEEVKRFRSILGEKLSNPQVIPSASQKHLKAIYGALSEDLEAYAKKQGPEALAAYKRANKFFRAGINRQEKIASSLDQKYVDDPEKLHRLVMGATKAGSGRESASELWAYKRSLPPERWDTVVTTLVRQLGQRKAGKIELDQQFSPQTFLTSWNQMSPRAKEILFSGTRYKELKTGLDEIIKISDTLRQAERYANPSGTARNIGVMMAFGLLGGGGVGSVTGGGYSSATAAGAAILSPRVAAKLITSPRFIKWLSDGSQVNIRNANSIGAWISKLATVAKIEPEIRHEIQLYLGAFRPLYQQLREKADTPFATEAQVRANQ